MSGDILYPKPLGKLVYENQPLPSGFLPKRSGGLKTNLALYSDKAFLLEKFLINDRLNNLHNHKRHLMLIYEKLIESGFSDVIFINTLLGEVSQIHRELGVTIDDITLQTQFIEEYIKGFLHKVTSAAAINGLKKLSELIQDHHRDKAEPEPKESTSKSENSI